MSDRAKWDSKYSAARGRPLADPDPFLLRALEHLDLPPGSRALDLACGSGRNTVELVTRGLQVEAWDVSPVGLELTRESVSALGAGRECRLRELDLLGTGIPGDAPLFDLVVVVNFLDEQLYQRLADLLAPGGHLLFTTFTIEWPGSKPPMIYRLQPGALAAGYPQLETILSSEAGGRAGLLARMPS